MAVPSNDPLFPVAEIVRRHNLKCTPEQLQAAVNVTFHKHESEHYDELHQDMWNSLPAQVSLLAQDALKAGAPEQLRMLDIGCGTGLATTCLLRTELGKRVKAVDLLDTSRPMLARAQKRREEWGLPGDTIEGLIESVDPAKQYDLIITSSVLHHVPDLSSFLNAVSALQKGSQGALFLHMQDPNGDFVDDPERRERESQKPKIPEWVARLSPRRVAGRLKREITGQQGQDYLAKTNRDLIKDGWISTPLTTHEIFSITDIHVQDGNGISTDRMKSWLPQYDRVNRRSYGFFGDLRNNLPAKLQAKEDELIHQGALNGAFVAAVWKRRA